MAADANFGLVRKKSSGKSVSEPLYGSLYFHPQSEVDEFLDAETTKTKKNVVGEICGSLFMKKSQLICSHI